MSVTVVGRWQVPAGFEEAASTRASHELAARSGAPPARRRVHVFQALDDPQSMLYVAEWSSRPAFEAYRDQGDPDTFEAVLRDREAVNICERLMFFGNYAYRAQVTRCIVVDLPAGAAADVQQVLLPNGRWAMHGSAGLVRYTVYREITHARRYVIVHGWQSTADLEAQSPRRAALEAALAGFSVTLRQFVGHEYASTDPL
ncbi:MAG: antibiotic biosynthesis monooxygenase [Chloroflexi bacterium]|nr:antibiotic biosynthesis monooxygenase [Chloroflexota bacterium]